MKIFTYVLVALSLFQGVDAQSVSTYSADYSANPFLDGSANDIDDSSWVSSAYGRVGAVVSNPTADAESFFGIDNAFYNHSVNSVGDSISLLTSFYSDSTTGSGAQESTVYLMLAPGVAALIGDIGDGSGNQQISLGIGSGAGIVTSPGFSMTTDQWVDVHFTATYSGNDSGGLATFNYELILTGGMVGTYTANGISQPIDPIYDVVGNTYSPKFGQEGDGDAQTIYWSQYNAANPVPEPSGMLLFGLGAMVALARRRR
ncbi:MAG: PEP-CTERM sorting domain-containing protein [Luteolibacter sp.]